MQFSALFIRRPVATILLAIGIFLAGIVAYRLLPVASLPDVDIPTIVIFANRPGADAQTMASSIAAPLERRLGIIPGVTEVLSINSVGATTIIVQFDVSRPIDAAAHDVQAALNAAVPDLPADLPNPPFFKKFNPADAPVLTLALTSSALPVAKLYDLADTILGQRLSQVEGVSQVQLSGAEKPAVRVQLNPQRLAAYGISSQQVLAAIKAANVLQPVGSISGPHQSDLLGVNGEMSTAAQYRKLIIRVDKGGVLRLQDVAHVVDGVANTRLAAWSGQQPAILLSISKESGANVIQTVDRVKAELPQLLTYLPHDVHLDIISDRTGTIRASVDDVQGTLAITVALVLLVVALFLRRWVPTLAAAATVPLSIAGTLAGMWALGYALDNFSLMALTISVGFVVDDAIVMIENIVRHMEAGEGPLEAAFAGAKQIGFTVVSISLSLVAVFIPLIFMGGILGRLLHEFAMTLTMAIAISALVSLTLTPMICGQLLHQPLPHHGLAERMDKAVRGTIAWLIDAYMHSLEVVLRFPRMMLLVMAATIGLTVWLYGVVPKGLMPIQDTGLLIGSTIAAPDISFARMSQLQREVVTILLRDPAVAHVGSNIGVANGFSTLNRGHLTVQLKPLDERKLSSEQVIARLRPKLAKLVGVQTFLYSAQDLRTGGRNDGSQFQFVLLGDNLNQLRQWTIKLEDKLRTLPGITDVSSDQDRAGPEAELMIDRAAAARMGVSVSAIDNALNNAYSQRQVSTIYTQRNQYKVVLEVGRALQTDPSQLNHIYVPGSGGSQVPLMGLVHVRTTDAAVSVRHQGQFPAATLSFNLPPGAALDSAEKLIDQTARDMRMPPDIRFQFAGNAKLLRESLASEPLLILAALISIYLLLGVLYESLIHPLTIISTLPSAGLGALLAILVTGGQLTIISIIAVLLLMGIVKKNGILLVDFALEAEREQGMGAEAAIRLACRERFRPILMTTLAALMGALPLALAFGTGSELRRPLGVAVIGGLIVSQILTLYTTPAVYLALERFSGGRRRSLRRMPAE